MFKTLGEQLRKPSGTIGKLVGKFMDARNRVFYEKIIRDLELRGDDRIYEIGFGTGLGINLIAEKMDNGSVKGIDFSGLMYSEATQRNYKYIANGTVTLSYGDFMTASFDTEKFDKVFCVNVIYFWSDLDQVFKKIHSMLNRDGVFCIFMTPDKEIANRKFAEEFFKYPISHVEFALLTAGFASVSYKLDKGYYIKARK